MVVNIVAIELQIRMTLYVVAETVVGLGRVEMEMNVFGIKVTLSVTNVVNMVNIEMSVLSGGSNKKF